eukprot:5939895-Pleurochrysis_carterae.AAC.2
MGCARLVLASGAHHTGRLATRLSMVAGHVRIIYKEPRRQLAMPRLTLGFFVLMLYQNGHIEWPANYTAKGQAILRKLARMRLKAMLEHAEYPVDPAMAAALEQSSSALLTLRPIPRRTCPR